MTNNRARERGPRLSQSDSEVEGATGGVAIGKNYEQPCGQRLDRSFPSVCRWFCSAGLRPGANLRGII